MKIKGNLGTKSQDGKGPTPAAKPPARATPARPATAQARPRPRTAPDQQRRAQRKDPSEFELAKRITRLNAVAIDGGLAIIALMFPVAGAALLEVDSMRILAVIILVLGPIALLSFGVMQIYLLVAQAQTVGKWRCGIWIVRPNGAQAEWWRLVFLRGVVIGLISNVCWFLFALLGLPTLGTVIFTVIDGGFIFRQDQRCLHDLIADTVVAVKPEE